MADTVGRALAIALSGGGEGGTSNYNDLSNKPKINGVTLQGNKSVEDLGIETLTAGDGLIINDNELAIDTEFVASKEDVQDVADDLADLEDVVATKSTVSGTSSGENWTEITIDGTTRNIPQGGGGSVNIDNKTIVENEDGELETAIGGYKETNIISGVILEGTGGDFDAVFDSDIISNIYDAVVAKGSGYEYSVTFTSNTEGVILHPEYTYKWKVRSITDSRIGDSMSLIVYEDEIFKSYCELYIDKGNNNIHLWDASGNQVFNPINGAKLVFQIDDFEPVYADIEISTYHKIDGNYVNVNETLIAVDNKLGLNIKQNGIISGNMVSVYNNKYNIDGVPSWRIGDYGWATDLRLDDNSFERYQDEYYNYAVRYKGTVLYTQYDAEEETLNISTTPFEEE